MAREPARLVEEVKEARAEFEARLDDLDAAKERYYDTVRRLYNAGMPLREIADAIGISHQRVHQIVGEDPAGARLRRGMARRARAGGVALVVVVFGTWLAATISGPQPRPEALADLQDARRFMDSQLPPEARRFVLPKIDEMLEEARVAFPPSR